MSRVAPIAVLLTVLGVPLPAAELPSPTRLLDAAISFHDPDGVWGVEPLEWTLEESRPDGSSRETRIVLDPARERFQWESTRSGHLLAGTLSGERCVLRLDGRADLTEKELGEHRLSCERLLSMRNYYSYLWGLPMKLRDPGTRLGAEVALAEFDGRSVFALEVTYDEAVGDDTWIFYFDPRSSALAGYRFYHQRSNNDGEYITLEGLSSGAGLVLPRRRAWFTNEGDEYLGTDTLIVLQRAENEPVREP